MWRKLWILYYKTRSLNWLCSVEKHIGSGDSTQEVGRNTRLWLMFPPTLLLCYRRFLHALQQNIAQLRLFYLLNIHGLSCKLCLHVHFIHITASADNVNRILAQILHAIILPKFLYTINFIYYYFHFMFS